MNTHSLCAYYVAGHMPGAGSSKVGNSQCVKVDRLDSYTKILANAIGAHYWKRAEHEGIILSGWKGEQFLGKATIGIIVIIIWCPISASQQGFIDIPILYPNPAASSVLFVNYSNIHHPLWHFIFFLCFIFLSLLSFLPANYQKIVSLTQTTSTFCFSPPLPLVFQRVYAFFKLMSVLLCNAKLKVVIQLKLVALICKLMLTKPGRLTTFSGKLKNRQTKKRKWAQRV